MKSLSDKYSVKVKDAGAGNRRYELYRKMPDGTTQDMKVRFDSVDDPVWRYRAGKEWGSNP